MAKKEEFIEEVIQSLPKIIKQYEDTLSERQITLEQKNPSLPTINAQINDNQNKPHREDETRLYRAAANSFPLLLQILKEPTLASQLSIQELIDLVKVNHDKGVDTNNLPNIDSITLSGVVTLEIYKRICGEVERRLNGKTINNYDEIKTFVVFSCQEQSQVLAHELGTNSYYQCHEKVAKNLTKTFSEKLEQPLYNAFVNIYQALYDGQSGPFKRNFLTRLDSSQSLEERIALIKALSEKDPNSRVATAWKLAQKHYLNCTPSNAKLFTKIHKEAFKRSWVFKRTKIVKDIVFFSSSNLNKKPDFTVEQINAGQKDPSSRRAKIANALLGR